MLETEATARSNPDRARTTVLVASGIAAAVAYVLVGEVVIATPALWMGAHLRPGTAFVIGTVAYIVVSSVLAAAGVSVLERAARSRGSGRIAQRLSKSLDSRRGAVGSALLIGGKATGFVASSLVLGPIAVSAFLYARRGMVAARRSILPSSVIWSVGTCLLYTGLGALLFG